METKTLIHGSVLAAIIIAAAIGVSLLTGTAGTSLFGPGTTVSDTTTGTAPAAQYITIDPIPATTTGSLLRITGSTNLPPGTLLMVQAGYHAGDAIVRQGDGGANRFSAPLDTSILKPGTIPVKVIAMQGDPQKGDYRESDLSATSSFTLNGEYLAADSPVTGPVAAGSYITLNPIGSHAVGDQFLITGKTSLPVGTQVMWQIIPYTGTVPAGIDMNAKGIMANTMVIKGDGTTNRVSTAVDMGNLSPGQWIAMVGIMTGDVGAGTVNIGTPEGHVIFTLT